jgi:hypothetical protein
MGLYRLNKMGFNYLKPEFGRVTTFPEGVTAYKGSIGYLGDIQRNNVRAPQLEGQRQDLFSSSIDNLVNAFGFQNARPFGGGMLSTFNPYGDLTTNQGPQGYTTAGETEVNLQAGKPIWSNYNINQALAPQEWDGVIAHEVGGHGTSYLLKNVNEVGGLRITEEKDRELATGITGFTGSDDFLGFLSEFEDNRGQMDKGKLQDALYSKFMSDGENNQRPALKHYLGNAVSNILTDSKLRSQAKESQAKGGWKETYAFEPEEFWGRAIEEYVLGINKFESDEFKGGFKQTNDVYDSLEITPETFKAIDDMILNIKVIEGSVMAKDDMINLIKSTESQYA